MFMEKLYKTTTSTLPDWFPELKNGSKVFAFVSYTSLGYTQYVFHGAATIIIEKDRLALKEYDPVFASWPLQSFGAYHNYESGVSCSDEETIVIFDNSKDYNTALDLIIEDIQLGADEKIRGLDSMKV